MYRMALRQIKLSTHEASDDRDLVPLALGGGDNDVWADTVRCSGWYDDSVTSRGFGSQISGAEGKLLLELRVRKPATR